MKQPKYLTTADKKVVIVYDNIDEAPIHSATPLENIKSLSDGYHTFDELYEFRKMYNAVLFNEWAKAEPSHFEVKNESGSTITLVYNSHFDKPVVPKYNVHKSWRHNDGELCFGGGWFIVSAMLPTGLISNHYKEKDWDLFQVPEVEKALYEFDGHTPQDVLIRLRNLI